MVEAFGDQGDDEDKFRPNVEGRVELAFKEGT